MANCLLRFYREVSGYLTQANPVRTLFQERNLLGGSSTITPAPADEVKDPTTTDDMAESIKQETDLIGSKVKQTKRAKRDTAEAPKHEADEHEPNISDLRDELNKILDPMNGWIARAQELQDQLETKDAALRKQTEDLKAVKKECEEASSLKASVEGLEAQIELMKDYLERKTKKAEKLTARVAEVEGQRDRLENNVAYQKQLTAELAERRDEDVKTHRKRMEEAEADKQRLRFLQKKTRRGKKGGGGKKGRGRGMRNEDAVDRLKKLKGLLMDWTA